MAWALNTAPVDSAQAALILVALAEHAHDDGTGAYPAQATIARKARCSVRTVRTYLGELEAAGLIVRGDQEHVAHFRPDRRPTVWNLSMHIVDKPVDGTTGKSCRAEIHDTTGGNPRPNDRQPVADKPSFNRPGMKEGSPPSSTSTADAAECGHGAPAGRCALCRHTRRV